MKKSVLIPILLFVAVFCETQFCQPYSLKFESWQSLFLLTADWFHEVFSYSFPVSTLLGSLLEQYYDVQVAGALIVAALVTAIYMCVNVFLRRTGLPFHRLVSLLAACACWSLTASAETNTAVVAVLLAAGVLALLSLSLRRRLTSPVRGWEMAAAALIVCIATVSVITNPSARKREAVSRAQVCACTSQWDRLLKAATPEACVKDPRLMPFAFLALGEKGTLGDRMFEYPLSGPQDFDMTGDNSAVGSFFNSILNEQMGSTNEAIHHIFQYSCHLPHGSSYISLLLLTRFNAEGGHYTMSRKYAEVLRRNPKSRRAASGLLTRYAGLADVCDSLGHSSASARVVTNNPAYNIGQFNLDGISSDFLTERFLCYALLEGDIERFRDAFSTLNWTDRPVPVHYQEALLLAGVEPSAYSFDERTVRKFSNFISAMQNRDDSTVESTAAGTYWAYYLKLQNEAQ